MNVTPEPTSPETPQQRSRRSRRRGRERRRRGLYLLVNRHFTSLAGNISRWPDEPPDAEGWVTFRLGFPEGEGEEGVNFGRARLFDLSGGLHLLVGNDVRERARVRDLVAELCGRGDACCEAEVRPGPGETGWEVVLGEVCAPVRAPRARVALGRAAPLGADTESVFREWAC